jgi:hypothetical protein
VATPQRVEKAASPPDIFGPPATRSASSLEKPIHLLARYALVLLLSVTQTNQRRSRRPLDHAARRVVARTCSPVTNHFSVRNQGLGGGVGRGLGVGPDLGVGVGLGVAVAVAVGVCVAVGVAVAVALGVGEAVGVGVGVPPPDGDTRT